MQTILDIWCINWLFIFLTCSMHIYVKVQSIFETYDPCWKMGEPTAGKTHWILVVLLRIVFRTITGLNDKDSCRKGFPDWNSWNICAMCQRKDLLLEDTGLNTLRSGNSYLSITLRSFREKCITAAEKTTIYSKNKLWFSVFTHVGW